LRPRLELELRLRRPDGARVQRDDASGRRAAEEERKLDGDLQRRPLLVLEPKTLEHQPPLRHEPEVAPAGARPPEQDRAGAARAEERAVLHVGDMPVLGGDWAAAELATLGALLSLQQSVTCAGGRSGEAGKPGGRRAHAVLSSLGHWSEPI